MIGTKFSKPLKDVKRYKEAADWCTSTQSATIVDQGDYYEVVKREFDRNLPLKDEKERHERWIAKHSYISALITSGMATAEEFKTELQEMKLKAIRIQEIDHLLEIHDGEIQ